MGQQRDSEWRDRSHLTVNRSVQWDRRWELLPLMRAFYRDTRAIESKPVSTASGLRVDITHTHTPVLVVNKFFVSSPPNIVFFCQKLPFLPWVNKALRVRHLAGWSPKLLPLSHGAKPWLEVFFEEGWGAICKLRELTEPLGRAGSSEVLSPFPLFPLLLSRLCQNNGEDAAPILANK